MYLSRRAALIGACAMLFAGRAFAQNVDAPLIGYTGKVFRPSQEVADWFEGLMRPNRDKLGPGEAKSCCNAGDAYPIVILQEATNGGHDDDGLAEVTDTSERMIVRPDGSYKFRPEWKSDKRFKFAGELITREKDGNPTPTAWVFAGVDTLSGELKILYCVVPLPPST